MLTKNEARFIYGALKSRIFVADNQKFYEGKKE